MSISDRLKVIEMIWTSISSSPQDVQSPLWHNEILKLREAKVSSDDATFLSIDDVRERLRRKSDEKRYHT